MQGKTDWERSVVNMNAILSCSLINSVGSGGATGDFQANRGIFGGGSGVKRRFKKRDRKQGCRWGAIIVQARDNKAQIRVLTVKVEKSRR